MNWSARRAIRGGAIVVAAACVVAAAVSLASAKSRRDVVRSLAFPAVSANGVTGDLIPPADSQSDIRFHSGKIAVGELPFGMPEPARVRRKLPRHFLLPAHVAPRARLFLQGAVGADGGLLSNTGNQLVVDARVDPPAAAQNPPPFSFPFDISGGGATLDVALPIQPMENAAVRVQVVGVRLLDPAGRVFGVLGFELVPMPLTPTPESTPTPVATKSHLGRCFVGSQCRGQSFPATQRECCSLLADPTTANAPLQTSWCAPDQIDPQTGRCAEDACQPCGPPPPPPDCGGRDTCEGRCTVTCDDGHQEVGVCRGDATCVCSAHCEPPPTTDCKERDVCAGKCVVTCADGQLAAGVCRGDATCECSAQCEPPPPPNGCGDRNECGGECRATCPDGSTAIGKCVGGAMNGARCACSVRCEPSPPPGPCDGRNVCGGACRTICADGSIAIGACTSARPNGFGCECTANCEPPPPNPCDQNACGGPCTETCDDGSLAKGVCLVIDTAPGRPHGCICRAECGEPPPPCRVGQCVDAVDAQCSGVRCESDEDCPSPGSICDIGRRCPCLRPPPPPLPHGHICCACKDPAVRCHDYSWIEVTPACPMGCETVEGAECDPVTNGCRPLEACNDDADCGDDNGCTIDRCTDEGCVHDCVCVNAAGCGPGPAANPHR